MFSNRLDIYMFTVPSLLSLYCFKQNRLHCHEIKMDRIHHAAFQELHISLTWTLSLTGRSRHQGCSDRVCCSLPIAHCLHSAAACSTETELPLVWFKVPLRSLLKDAWLSSPLEGYFKPGLGNCVILRKSRLIDNKITSPRLHAFHLSKLETTLGKKKKSSFFLPFFFFASGVCRCSRIREGGQG